MVIKNKDGTVYKVRSPNPIMMTQEIWDKFTVHNMKFDADTVSNKDAVKPASNKIDFGVSTTIKQELKQETIKIPQPVEKPKVIQNNKIQEFEIPDFKKPEPSPEPKKEDQGDVLRPASINEKLKNYRKDIMHCMLAETKEIVDPLYDDKTIKVNYTRSFVFENIIIQENDMELVFWSHLDFLTRNSIVYPKNDGRRWWKISSIRSAPEGSFFVCVPTSTQPSFK